MNEIYWITRLDCINGWLIASAATSGVLAAVLLIVYFIVKSEYVAHQCAADKRQMDFCKSVIKPSAIVFFTSLIISILTPTKKEAMLIWGVGSTIDYIKENETIKQLPDKCVNALDAWVESLSDKEER